MSVEFESDLRVLRAAVELYEPTGRHVRISELYAAIDDLDTPRVDAAVRRLITNGYMEGPGTWNGPYIRITRITERGLRSSGFWPSPEDAFAGLVARLAAMADAEPDPGRKAKIRSVYENVRDLGTDFGVGVAASMAASGVFGLM